ncbi:MAG: TonB-dependent receptor, partial [Gammaproteobacteria bacterium]
MEYVPKGNTMYYGRVSKGYRAGGFSTYQSAEGFDAPQIKEETLINYEIGVKTQSDDQRLTLASSAFLAQYDDMQINLTQNYPPGAIIAPTSRSPLVTFTANIPTSDLYGAEVEFSYYPTERWRLSGYYVYFDSSLGSHMSVTP